MAYGIIEYNEKGQPMCEICGKYFERVMSHVRQKHNMNEREYKQTYGLNLGRGICSERSSQLSREKALDCMNNTNYMVDLLIRAKETQFKKGHNKGRSSEQLSQQARNAFKERIKTDKKLQAAMIENGRRLGKSGVGNKKRRESGVAKKDKNPIVMNSNRFNIIMEELSKATSLSPDIILGRRQDVAVSDVRHCIIYMFKVHLGIPNQRIALLFERDDSTIRASVKKIKNLIGYDDIITTLIDRFSTILKTLKNNI